MNGLVYSPKERIPLFRILYNSSRERTVEYLNPRTGNTELVKVSRLVIYLLEKQMLGMRQKNMIYSPGNKIPLGMLFQDEQGNCFIEVKYKKHKECIRFITYVSLLLEAENR